MKKKMFAGKEEIEISAVRTDVCDLRKQTLRSCILPEINQKIYFNFLCEMNEGTKLIRELFPLVSIKRNVGGKRSVGDFYQVLDVLVLDGSDGQLPANAFSKKN